MFRKQNKPKAPITAKTKQTGHVGMGNVVNVQGSRNTLAIGAAAPINPPAEQVRVDVKEAIPQRRLLWATSGGVDLDSGQPFRNEVRMPTNAELRIVCHNLTGTPVTIDEIRLMNADSNQEVRCFDGESKRMDGFGPVEIKLKLPLDNTQSYETPPPWRGLINITTVRGGSFDSKPFEWGKK
jgi:hypothetical protein